VGWFSEQEKIAIQERRRIARRNIGDCIFKNKTCSPVALFVATVWLQGVFH